MQITSGTSSEHNLAISYCRRRPLDETAAQYDVAMETVFETLCNASKAYFTELHQRASSNLEEEDEGSVEFGECLCEAMVALGSQNLHCVARDESKVTVYLHQVSCFTMDSASS